MSEGLPKAFSRIPREEAPAPVETERVPTYLEDPTARQERDVRELQDSLRAQFEELSFNGELAGLEGDALLERVGDMGVAAALDLVERKYGNPLDPESRLAFHDREHSESVVKRVEELVDAINAAKPGTISVLERTQLRLDAANHDDEHVFYVENGIRKRRLGVGEERSAARLTELKRAANENLRLYGKPEAFIIDAERDKRAIDVTVPDFVPGKGVVQKYLTRETPLTNRLLALADLGDFGMEGAQKLLDTGKRLAIEDNADIVEAVRAGGLTSEQKEVYRGRLLGFMNFQPSFAESRYNRFAEELEGVEDPVVEAAVRGKFKYFADEAYSQARQELTDEMMKIANYSFEEMCAYVGMPEFIEKTTPDARRTAA